jgi:hypothetical protein
LLDAYRPAWELKIYDPETTQSEDLSSEERINLSDRYLVRFDLRMQLGGEVISSRGYVTREQLIRDTTDRYKKYLRTKLARAFAEKFIDL